MRAVGEPIDGLIFDRVAALYDRVRPTYPTSVFDAVESAAGLVPDSCVVEIGPGTGQATQSLRRRGWDVTAIEPGPNLAALAAERFADDSKVSVVVARFEEWSPPDGRYDAVFAATAWHWIDPARAYPKAVSVLRTGGSLAIVETHHVVPNGGDSFFAEIQEVYDEIGEPDRRGGPPDPDDVGEPLAAPITESGWFEPPVVSRHLWSMTYSADAYIDVLRTYSGHIAMTDDQRARLFEAIRERVGRRRRSVVEKHYLNLAYVARRR